MADSGIMKDVLRIEKINKSQATHFALCNGEVIRYLIDLNDGKQRISKNISTYSGKLGILMKMINIVPFYFFKVVNIGCFVRVKLEHSVEEQRKQTDTKFWNVIIGTYDKKQKLVMQCFDKTGDATYVKIGNQATDKEMATEIRFLAEGRRFQTFDIPTMKGYCLRENGNQFNIQVTKEFYGEKVAPEITPEIIALYMELSGEKRDGLAFSHGDFAPWNIKRTRGRFVLFDWENCGYRMEGFDIMHYATIIEMVIGGKNVSSAFDCGLANIREYVPEFCINKQEFLAEFNRMRTQIA